MNNLRVKNVKINAFRGIKNEDLDLDSSSLILLGENGTGKSSFVNAFEYLFSSKVSSLSGSADIHHNDVIVYKDCNPEDLSVEVTFENGYRIKRTIKGVTKDNELSYLVDSFKRSAFILNRKKLLKFIDSQPKERYNAIGSLFDLDYLDNIESVLRKSSNFHTKELSTKKEELMKFIIDLGLFLKLEFPSLPKKLTKRDISARFPKYLDYTFDILDEINKLLKENDFPEIGLEDNLNEYWANFQKSIIDKPAKPDFEPILKIIKLLNFKEIEEELEKFYLRYQDLALRNFRASNDLLNVLKSSKKYLDKEDVDLCPVCSNPINRTVVLEELSNSIDTITKESKELRQWKKDSENIISLLKNVINNLNLLNNEFIHPSLSKYADDLKKFTFISDNLIDLIDKITALTNFETIEFEYDFTVYNNNLKELEEFVIKAEEENKSDVEDNLTVLSKSILDLNNLYKEKSKIESLENLVASVTTTYNLYQKMKINYMDNILSSITDKINEYYSFLHGKDAIKDPKIIVSGSTGLKLKINSFDSENDPREYASEGHLDTLGLCIFLAFVREYNDVPFIILDDIIATVDSSHKERVARLLFEKFSDYQVIITTHNKLWFRQIGELCRANKNYDYKQIEITDWTLEEGPYLAKHRSDDKMIAHYLECNDLHAAANAARRHLESVTKEICLANEARMFYKKKYQPIEFFKGARNSLTFLTQDTSLNEFFNDKFLEIEKTRYMANCLSHDSEVSNFLTNKEVRTFCDAVFDLENSVTCQECGAYLRFNLKTHRATCTNRNCGDSFKFE